MISWKYVEYLPKPEPKLADKSECWIIQRQLTDEEGGIWEDFSWPYYTCSLEDAKKSFDYWVKVEARRQEPRPMRLVKVKTQIIETSNGRKTDSTD